MTRNITFELLRQAVVAQTKTALITSNEEINYGKLDQLVWKAATLLYEKGLRPGDRIGILQKDELLRVLCTLGLIRLGATVVPLARSLTSHQRDEIFLLTEIKTVISDFLTFSNLQVSIILVDLQQILNQASIDHDVLCEHPENDCLLVPGSGSSGKPKIIPQSHQMLTHRISLAFAANENSSNERILSLTNLEFASGINRLLSVISLGSAFSVVDRPIDSIDDYCHRNNITILFTSVFHMESLLQKIPKGRGLLLPGLSSLRISGSSVSIGLRTAIRDLVNPNLYLVYGANECGRITAATPPQVYEDQFTVGKPLAGVEVELVDSNDCLLPLGKRGQIRVRTPSLVTGYVNDLEATKKAFKDGWFYTGDIGEFTTDGALRLFGRSDDMMIVNGINIYPIEIEQTLREIHGVFDVVALPLSDKVSQDIPIAVVSPNANTKLDATEIQKIALARLGFRAPRKVFVLEEIPRNSNGKVQRKELMQLLKQSKLSAEDLFNDALLLDNRSNIKIKLLIPEFAGAAYLKDWAWALLEQKTWSADAEISGQESFTDQERLFVHALLQTTRLLCELGRLPIFDPPKVVSLSRDPQNPKKYLLGVDFFLVQFLPQAAYKIPIQVSLDLCRWMAQNKPTPENKNKVFNTIAEKVIKPLHRHVPGGKSTIPVLKVAHILGIPFAHLGLGVYQLGWGSKARRLDRSTCELDSAIGSKLAQNKVLTANILRAAGLPAPIHGVVTTENDAISLAKNIGFPVVIKPTDRDRGEGVTVDISDEAGLKTAFAHAQKLSESKQVIVERQVSGVCHRLFIANDKLLYAVKRHPMSVIGDGKKTISELVESEITEQNNKPPWNRSEIKPIDDLALKSFKALGYSSQSVPGKGVMIPLRRIESTEWGGVDEEVTAFVNTENLRIAIEATKLFGLHVAGIDIISPDITKPWHSNESIINEVNFAPLFGGAEISRSHIPAFFAEFIEGNGKIPIQFFENEDAAMRFQTKQSVNKKRCFTTSATRTTDHFGNEIKMAFKDLKKRIGALILRSDVDSIAIIQ